MHTSTTPSGTRYHYNSDFSGDIHIVVPVGRLEIDGNTAHAVISADDIRSIAANADGLDDLPPAWADLLEALTLLARHPTDPISPFNCEHDELTVLSDPEAFTDEELLKLANLGFGVSGEGAFYSFRFGSA